MKDNTNGRCMLAFSLFVSPKGRKSLIIEGNSASDTADQELDGDLTVPGQEGATTERVARLREVVDDAGGTVAVARSLHMHQNTLSRYLQGRDMKSATLVALADKIGVSVEWLATGRGSKRPVTVGPLEHQQGELTFPMLPGTVRIARYDARASAGVQHLQADAAIIEQISFSADWIRTVLRRNPAHLALLECRGDSMEPTLRDGDVLMVDTSVQDVISDRIYVLDVGGSLRVKRIQQRLDGSLLILSDNPRYQPEVIHPSERQPLRIVGEVVWWAGLAR